MMFAFECLVAAHVTLEFTNLEMNCLGVNAQTVLVSKGFVALGATVVLYAIVHCLYVIIQVRSSRECCVTQVTTEKVLPHMNLFYMFVKSGFQAETPIANRTFLVL